MTKKLEYGNIQFNMKNIYFICGYICSGKTTLCLDIAKDTGAKFIDVSDIVREILNAISRDQLQGHPELDQQIVDKIMLHSKHYDNLVIAGARQLSIIKMVEQSVDDNTKVHVRWLPTPIPTCYKRYLKKNNCIKDQVRNRETFLQALQKDDQLGLSQIKQYAQNQ